MKGLNAFDAMTTLSPTDKLFASSCVAITLMILPPIKTDTIHTTSSFLIPKISPENLTFPLNLS